MKIDIDIQPPGMTEFNKALERFAAAMIIPVSEMARTLEQLVPKLQGLAVDNDLYYKTLAPPSAVVDFILRHPDHTWNGVTIHPDEAWRYRCKDDWMWWKRE